MKGMGGGGAMKGMKMCEAARGRASMAALAFCRFAHFLAAMLAFGMSAYLWPMRRNG